MEITDVRNLPDDEIHSEIDKVRAKIFKMKFQAKGAGVENPSACKGHQRDVARMLTVLRERQLKKTRS